MFDEPYSEINRARTLRAILQFVWNSLGVQDLRLCGSHLPLTLPSPLSPQAAPNDTGATMRRLVITTAAILLLTACGQPPAPPVLVEESQVEATLHQANTLDGKRVSVDGYIHVDDGRDEGAAAAMAYTLTSRMRGQGEDLVLFKAELGKAANQVDLPVLSSEPIAQLPNAPPILTVDLKNGRFQDSAGASHPLTTRVRVTGRLASGTAREDGASLTGQTFSPMLMDVSLEAAPEQE